MDLPPGLEPESDVVAQPRLWAIVANGFGKRALPASADGKLVVKSGDALKLR